MGSTSREKTLVEFNDCITGLALNASSTKVVIGGRRLLKVICLEDGRFGEQLNIRLREQPLLNYNSIDVAWSPHHDNLIASGAANGAVILWDLNKTGRRKIDHIFNAHDRTCNRLSFHTTDPNLMLSGAQDGKMALMDIRSRNITHIYDKETPPISIRDVQFSTLQSNMIAAGYDNGYVETWDMRNTAHWEKQFTAHYGPVFTLDWHPEERHWLATGGRDKIIKVWNVVDTGRPPIYNLQMIASTARIKWRPLNKYQLGSCAQLMDFGVNIWDVRRPYVAFATFGKHRDIATGFEWLRNDPNHLVSCGKDGMLVFHRYGSSDHPVDNVCPVTVRLNPYGHVLHAFNSKLASVCKSSESSTGRIAHPHNHLSSVFQRPFDRSESHPAAVSRLFQYSPTDKPSTSQVVNDSLSMDWFVTLARQYQLSGESPTVLCEINAEVASRARRSEVAQTWRMLGIMVPTIASSDSTALMPSAISQTVTSHTSSQPQLLLSSAVAAVTERELVDKPFDPQQQTQQKMERRIGHGLLHSSTGPSDSESGEYEDDDALPSYMQRAYTTASQDAFASSSTMMRSLSPTDMMFGDMDFLSDNLGVHFESESKGHLNEWQQCNLPSEAFEPRFDRDDDDSGNGAGDDVDSDDEESRFNQPFTPFCETPAGTNNMKTMMELGRQQRYVQRVVEELPIKPEILNITPFNSCVPTLDFSKVIISMVRQYASQNDVQMAVSVLLCLGDKYIRLIDQLELEQWFFSYIELLQQFELFTIATAIIKLSPTVREVYDLTRTSTRVNTSCTGCGRPLLKSGWLCDRCNGYVHVCSVCHLPVKGLYMWCQGCSHGGHIEHVQNWFDGHNRCPSGCGHECEYT